MIKRLLPALLLCAVFTSHALADFNDGVLAFRAKDYETAAALWKPLAEEGDPKAQTNLGLLYARGLGVPKDGEQALHWFEMAAEQGYAVAEFNLATIFAKGVAVEPNQVQATTWYLRAAQHGHIGAQYEIGRRYAEGNGIRYDEVEAYAWLSRAEKRAKGKLLDRVSAYKTRLAESMSEEEIVQGEALAAENG